MDQLRTTVEWRACTPKQQLWLESFIESQNALFATRTTYQCKTDRNAQILSYEIPKQERVRAALDLYFGRSNRDEFLNRLQRRIESGDLTVAQMEATKLLCSLRGWTCPALQNTHGNPTAAQSEPKHFVDQIVKQNGNRFKVTAVDVAGKIIAVEPIL